jgi:hypothetical protein
VLTLTRMTSYDPKAREKGASPVDVRTVVL